MPSSPGRRADTIWITWERQRRTLELADALDVPLRILLSRAPYLLRAAWLTARTLGVLAARRPAVLMVQNPSLVLAAVACLARPLGRYRLIVDRHSNFKFPTLGSRSPKYRLFHLLSRRTARAADLTIVTNRHLQDVVTAWGGRALVLPDRIPRLPLAARVELPPGANVVCVSSFNRDEPIAEVVAAAALLDGAATLHVTGDHRRCPRSLRERAPANLRFTGFLADAAYQSLLASCDAVMVLTEQEHTLLCGAYEAVALGRPLILSDTVALRAHFGPGPVFTANRAPEIAAAVRDALGRRESLANEMAVLAAELRAAWERDFARLVGALDALRRGGGVTECQPGTTSSASG